MTTISTWYYLNHLNNRLSTLALVIRFTLKNTPDGKRYFI